MTYPSTPFHAGLEVEQQYTQKPVVILWRSFATLEAARSYAVSIGAEHRAFDRSRRHPLTAIVSTHLGDTVIFSEAC